MDRGLKTHKATVRMTRQEWQALQLAAAKRRIAMSDLLARWAKPHLARLTRAANP